jgi:hypothetical protein
MDMSAITLIITIGSVLATAVFAAGYWRGVQNAINDFRQGETEEAPVPQDGHWGGIALAFALSIVSIAGIGYTPYFVYAGPFLVLVTTFGVGLAFFIEKKVPATKP